MRDCDDAGRLRAEPTGRAPGGAGVRARRAAGGMILHAGDDRGSGSVLALAIMCAVLTVAGGALLVVGAVAARARAAAGADLAALAAAEIVAGPVAGVASDGAGQVAGANGAELAECVREGAIVTVVASVPYLGLRASAAARAGPADGG